MTKCDPVRAAVACDTRNINEPETRGLEPDTLINVIPLLSLKESAVKLHPFREENRDNLSNCLRGIVGYNI